MEELTRPAPLAGPVTFLWNGFEIQAESDNAEIVAAARERAADAYVRTLGSGDGELWNAFVMTLAPSERRLLRNGNQVNSW
jgi:hypothetical protein